MDTHGMKFVVDTTGIAKGFRDYRSAVDGIFASLSKFEAHVDKTMKGVAKASANPQAINAFKKAVQAFSNVDIDTSAAKKLSALSAAMSGFKAPSPTQTNNVKKFFGAFANVPDLTSAYRSIKSISSLKTAMEGFKAPPVSQATNLTKFAAAAKGAVPGLQALSGISGISGVANELASISLAMRNLKAPSSAQVTNLGNLAMALKHFNFTNLGGASNLFATFNAISNFKAPSPAQIRNLESFIKAVADIKVPPNAAAVSSALMNIATAANHANATLGGFRSRLGSFGSGFTSFNNGARQAGIQMMGLQNAFSATFQAGSLLRSLLGSLTIAELGRNFFEASGAALQFRAQMSVLSKDVGFANAQLQWVNETANRFGTDMLAAEQGFGKISIAADKAGMSFMQTRHVFEGFSSAMSVLGVTTAGQGDVWLALQQVMNKGYLSAEELNQQLNEKLPGAMAYAGEYAKSLGTTLEKGLKDKILDAQGVLDHMAKRMKEDFGPAVALALQRPQQQMNILKNNINSLFQAIGEAGGNKAFADFLGNINAKLTPEAIDRYAAAIGEGLKNAVDKLSTAFNWLYNNWDSIKGPLSTTLSLLGQWMVLSGTLQIGKWLVMPLMQVGNAVAGLRAAGLAVTALATGATTASAAMAGTAAATTATATATTGMGAAAAAASGGFATLRAAMTAFIATTGASMLSASTAAGAFRALGAAAGGAAVTGIRSLVTLLGGAYLLTVAAAGYATYQMYQMYNEGQDTVYGATDAIAALKEKTDAATASIYLNTDATGINGGQQNFLSGALSMANGFMDSYKIKLDQATGGLYSMAAAARTAAIENLKLAQTDLTGKLAEAKMQSSGALMKQAGNLWQQGRYGMAAGAHLYAQTRVIGQKIGYSPSEKDATATISQYETALKNTNAQLAAAQASDPYKIALEMKNRGVGGGTPQGPKPAGGGAGSKPKKGPKGTNPEDAAKKIENIVDQMMDKFKEVDPVGGLYQDFIQNLSKQGHALLNEKGYATFLANIKGKAGDTAAQTQALIASMQGAGNLSEKTMSDLTLRYGKGVKDMIELLVAQQAAYEDALKGKTIEAIDFKFKGAKDLMESLGDSIPKVQQLSDTISKLTPLARAALSNDELKTWLGELRDGSKDAAMAGEDLASSILLLAKTSPTLQASLKNIGLTAEQAAQAAISMGNAIDYARKMAERDIPFGAKTTREMDQDLIKGGMSEREAGIYDKLTTSVKEYLEAGSKEGPLTQEKIKWLESEIRKRQELGDQLQRNVEHFKNNGVRTYINDIKSAGEAVQELDKNVLTSLEDQLYTLGTTGEFSFKAIFDTIHQGMMRFASQSIMKSLTEGLFGGSELEGGDPSLFGGLFKAMGLDTGAKKAGPLGETMKLGSSAANAMWVRSVNVNGTTGDLMNGLPPSVTVGPDGMALPANDNAGTANNLTGPDSPVTKAATKTASSFQSTMTGMMPMLGMAFASSFKSPIAQVGVMFATMLIQQMMTSQMAGGAGGGGILGGIGKFFGGLFSEGGYSNSPVSYGSMPAGFTNIPHYAEGTPNTSGGMPAILHDNEAVIPLSRGRKIPVEMSGNKGGQTINNNFNISSPDADSFRKSKGQIATQMYMASGRAARRNG